MRRALIPFVAACLSLLSAGAARADESERLVFEIDFRLGPVVSSSEGADPELASGAGLELGMGAHFLSSAGWGLGIDVAGDFELDGTAPSYATFVTELYAMHRFRVGESDFVALRLGPSLWYADASTDAGCGEACSPEVEQRRAEIDLHDSVILGGVAGMGFSHAFGPLLVGADVRGRLGHAFADDASPLRAQVLLVLHVTMRVPPRMEY